MVAPELSAGPLNLGTPQLQGAAAGVEVSHQKRLGIAGWLAIGWLGLLVGSAILAPILPVGSPTHLYLDFAGDGPGTAGHILGLDTNGHDVLAETIYGARESLIIAIGAVSAGILVGGSLGLIAGYFKGKIDLVISMLFDILLAVPALILAMSLSAFLRGDPSQGAGLPVEIILVIALGIVSAPPLGRITRASALTWSERDFVTAARAQGAKSYRVMTREVLPNVLPAMFSIALLAIAVVIVAEGGLALLGVGVDFTTKPSLGNMIAVYAQSDLRDHPYLVFTPIICIFLTVLSLNFLGDVIRAHFDARETTL